MSDVLVQADSVSKKFCKNMKLSMLYGMQNIANAFIGRAQATDSLRNREFWALENVSFELKRGECLGLVGPNGSGKSTMLKILNGIITPDKGKVTMRGRVGALIEVSAGFHPMLTGRENIYINGAILGFSKKEIDRKFDEIVDFSGLEDFIDTPVKHYSSGMYVRLGFAVAAQMEPDVLLIDEVLTVGDIGFRSKCFNAIDKITKHAAVIFVSHLMPQVSRICSQICVFQKGEILYLGDSVAQGINEYYACFQSESAIISGSGKAQLHHFSLNSGGRQDIDTISYKDELVLSVHFTVDNVITSPIAVVSFMTQEYQLIAQLYSSFNKVAITNNGQVIKLTIRIPELIFTPGLYFLTLTFLDEKKREVLLQHYAAKKIQVNGKCIAAAPLQLTGEWTVG